MLGAIIGDIVGSRFEWNNHRNKDFNLFSDECCFTDDTVMTLAVAKALLDCEGDYSNLSEKAIAAMQEIGRSYPDRGYGGMFERWIYSDNPKSYYSYGNGAAMRISPCGFVAKTLEEAKALSRKVTEVTHNHPEGIKGAEATTVAIFLARKGYEIEEIREYINKHYYNMDFTLDQIRDTYEFNETCQETVPQAIMAFLESMSFEDAIKNAISIGGDSDTIAAITGGIAEAYYGVPLLFENLAKRYLDENLLMILNNFQNKKKIIDVPVNLCGNQHVYKDRLIRDLLEHKRDILLNSDTNNAICYDGIVDEKAYSNQKYRLAFLLKETNGNTPDGKTPDHYCDWDYVAWIRDKQSTGVETIYPTFRNIAMWTSAFYDIFEGGEADKSKYLVNGTLQITNELRKALRRIAVINLKKSFGGGSTDWNDLNAYLNQDVCDVLREEICIARPSIVLCGGQQVFDLVCRIHQCEKDSPLTLVTANGNTVEYIPADDCIYVNFYHPACRKSREMMFDYAVDVFEALKASFSTMR